MPRRRALIATLLGCLLWVPAAVTGTATAQSPTPAYHAYVALGDSFQADSAILPGITTGVLPQ